MEILHFYKTTMPYSVGGGERIIHELASGAAARGHRVNVLTLGRTAETRQYGAYTIHCCPISFEMASTPISASVVSKFRALAQAADIVNYHYPWPFMDLVHFATGAAKVSVVTYHSDIVRQRAAEHFYAPLRRAFLSSVDAIVATSPNYRASSKTLQPYLPKVSVIPLGVADASLQPPSEGALRRWRTRVGERFFLFVGVLRYYKGLHILLEAAHGTGIPIVIAGSGPTEPELSRHARLLNADNIHLVGQVTEDDKAALISLCAGVVFPSHLRAEAFGVTLLEGALYGKPLISSEIGTGTSYVNIDGETGIVVPPNDPAALRSALQRLWDNAVLASEHGRRARARYEALFTSDRMSDAYVALYGELIYNARRRGRL